MGLRSGRGPGPGRGSGDRQFLAYRTIPADGKPPHVVVLEKISFQKVFQVFPSTHGVALGAGAFGNHQLTGLIGANNHVFSIFRQPFVRCRLFLSQGLLLL